MGIGQFLFNGGELTISGEKWLDLVRLIACAGHVAGMEQLRAKDALNQESVADLNLRIAQEVGLRLRLTTQNLKSSGFPVR
jgi:hypothetical protein